jgi:hypothetical protein
MPHIQHLATLFPADEWLPLGCAWCYGKYDISMSVSSVLSVYSQYANMNHNSNMIVNISKQPRICHWDEAVSWIATCLSEPLV